jgi:hypothetical protein
MHGQSKGETRPLIFGCIDFLSGSIGSVVNVLVGLPLDTVKVKMQMYPNLYGGSYHCFESTYRKYGIRHGLYAGMWPALAADVSEKSVLFCAYG